MKKTIALKPILLGTFLLFAFWQTEAQAPCGASATLSLSEFSICEGEETDFEITTSFTVTDVQWQWVNNCGGFCDIPDFFLSNPNGIITEFDSDEFIPTGELFSTQVNAIITHTGGSCITTDEDFFVKPKPVFSLIENDVFVCPGEPGTLEMVDIDDGPLSSNCDGDCIFEWFEEDQVSLITSGQTLTQYPSETTTYVAKATLSGCTGRETGRILPNGPDAGEISGLVFGEVNYCSGEIINILSASPGQQTDCSDYEWRIDGVEQVGETGETLSNITLPTVTAEQDSVLIQRFLECTVDGEICENSADLTLYVNPIPTLFSTFNTDEFCHGSTFGPVNFSVDIPGSDINWFGNFEDVGGIGTGTGNISAFTLDNTTGADIILDFEATASNAGCESDPFLLSCLIIPEATVNSVSDILVCSGEQVTQNFSGNFEELDWTNSNSEIGIGTSGQGNLSFVGASPNGNETTGNISATPVNIGPTLSCPGSPALFEIEVVASPDLTISDVEVCTGESVMISPSGTFSSFTWTNDNSAVGLPVSGNEDIDFVGSNGTSEPLVANISFTATLNTCIGDPQSVSVTVFPPPSLDAFEDQILCAGESLMIEPQGAFESTTWTNSNTAIGLGTNGTGNINFSSTNLSDEFIESTIVYTPSNPVCSGSPETFTITVYDLPTVDTENISVCNGDEVTSAFVASDNFSWSISDSGIGLPATGEDNFTFTAENTTQNTIDAILSVVPFNDGCDMVTPISVEIEVFPSPNINFIQDVSACAGSPITSIPEGSFGIANWTNDNTSIGLPAAGTGNIDFTPVNTSSENILGNITYTPVFESCAGNPVSFSITVIPEPLMNEIPDALACAGDEVNITPTGNFQTSVWSNSNISVGLSSSGNGAISFESENLTTDAIMATVTFTPQNGVCEGETETVAIEIFPAASFSGSGANLCNNVGEYILDPQWNQIGTYTWDDNLPADVLATNNETGALTLAIPPSSAGNTLSFGISGEFESPEADCSVQRTFELVIYEAPSAAISPTNTTFEVCSNEVTDFSSEMADSYAWSCENCNLSQSDQQTTEATWLNNTGSDEPTGSTLNASLDLIASNNYLGGGLVCSNSSQITAEISDFIMPTSEGIIQAQLPGLLVVDSPDAEYFQWGTVAENDVQEPIAGALSGNLFSGGESCEELEYYVNLSLYEDFTCALTLSTCFDIVGIEELSSSTFNIWPNPNIDGVLYIDLSDIGCNSQTSATIISMHGETLAQYKLPCLPGKNMQIELPREMSKGVYLFRLYSNGKYYYSRILKS